MGPLDPGNQVRKKNTVGLPFPTVGLPCGPRKSGQKEEHSGTSLRTTPPSNEGDMGSVMVGELGPTCRGVWPNIFLKKKEGHSEVPMGPE